MPLPYHAGKTKLAPHISKVIFKKVKENSSIKNYAEPFSGMMRVGVKVMEDDKEKVFKKYMFSDVNDTISVLFNALKKGWIPKVENITQKKWESYKKNKTVSAQKSFIGYSLGFGGQYFGGAEVRLQLNKGNLTKEKWALNYLKNKRQYLKELQPYFKSSKFMYKEKSVFDLDFKNAIIYCDPPYISTQFRSKTRWNKNKENKFWDKVDSWLEPSKNNIVLISNSKRTKKMKGLRIKKLFDKDFESIGSWKKTKKNRLRKEMLFEVVRTSGRKTRKKRGGFSVSVLAMENDKKNEFLENLSQEDKNKYKLVDPLVCEIAFADNEDAQEGIYTGPVEEIFPTKKTLDQKNDDPEIDDDNIYSNEDYPVYRVKDSNIGGKWETRGYLYEGGFKNAAFDGHGKFTWTDDGHIYEGEFSDGKFHGKGKLTVKGVKEGEINIGGYVYDGEWKNNLKNGIGTCKWNDGCEYVGMWAEDNINGEGKFTNADMSVYEGALVEGRSEGKGKKTWTNGDVYDGDWINNQRHGKGLMTWKNNDNSHSYKGDWEKDKREGKGILVINNMLYDNTTWKDDVCNKKPTGKKIYGGRKTRKKRGGEDNACKKAYNANNESREGKVFNAAVIENL